jgi:hypothetical protein
MSRALGMLSLGFKRSATGAAAGGCGCQKSEIVSRQVLLLQLYLCGVGQIETAAPDFHRRDPNAAPHRAPSLERDFKSEQGKWRACNSGGRLGTYPARQLHLDRWSSWWQHQRNGEGRRDP